MTSDTTTELFVLYPDSTSEYLANEYARQHERGGFKVYLIDTSRWHSDKHAACWRLKTNQIARLVMRLNGDGGYLFGAEGAFSNTVRDFVELNTHDDNDSLFDVNAISITNQRKPTSKIKTAYSRSQTEIHTPRKLNVVLYYFADDARTGGEQWVERWQMQHWSHGIPEVRPVPVATGFASLMTKVLPFGRSMTQSTATAEFTVVEPPSIVLRASSHSQLQIEPADNKVCVERVLAINDDKTLTQWSIHDTTASSGQKSIGGSRDDAMYVDSTPITATPTTRNKGVIRGFAVLVSSECGYDNSIEWLLQIQLDTDATDTTIDSNISINDSMSTSMSTSMSISSSNDTELEQMVRDVLARVDTVQHSVRSRRLSPDQLVALRDQILQACTKSGREGIYEPKQCAKLLEAMLPDLLSLSSSTTPQKRTRKRTSPK